MSGNRKKRVWADPNLEGRGKDRQSRRFCSRCGNSVQQVRIFKSLNLCEFCMKELAMKRDGVYSCRICGRIAPEELKKHQGYCLQCICPACGKPDPESLRKTGLCYQCAQAMGDFCRKCGKEASAQVRKNRGLCNQCFSLAKSKHSRQIHGTTPFHESHPGWSGPYRR